ncbi:MAG TPA: response regulator [Gammaproteobacteria bacterium]
MTSTNSTSRINSGSGGPSGKSILIVDDNEINQKLLRVYLLSMGFQVHISKDGYSALNILQKHAIDLIFLDVHMPVMNGFETTRAIRQLGDQHKRIPIIGLSADGLPNSQHQALQSGMDEYLVKPIKQDDLQQILNRWFHTSSEQFAAGVISKADDLRLMLMKEMPDYKLRLVAALDNHNYAEIYEVAHRIAGGSAYCDVPELHRISDLLQTAARRKNDEQIDLYSAGLIEHINHLLRDIAAVGNG